VTPNENGSKALYAAHVVFTAQAMPALIVEELVLTSAPTTWPLRPP